MNQEILLLARISLEVPIEWTKSDIMYIFSGRHMSMMNNDGEIWQTIVDIVDIADLDLINNLE